MTGVIFEKNSGRIVKHFDTLRGARGCFTRKFKVNGDQLYVVCSGEDYEKTGYVTANEMIDVRTIYGKTVKIRRSDAGTACDPSTERYWTM